MASYVPSLGGPYGLAMRFISRARPLYEDLAKVEWFQHPALPDLIELSLPDSLSELRCRYFQESDEAFYALSPEQMSDERVQRLRHATKWMLWLHLDWTRMWDQHRDRFLQEKDARTFDEWTSECLRLMRQEIIRFDVELASLYKLARAPEEPLYDRIDPTFSFSPSKPESRLPDILQHMERLITEYEPVTLDRKYLPRYLPQYEDFVVARRQQIAENYRVGSYDLVWEDEYEALIADPDSDYYKAPDPPEDASETASSGGTLSSG